MLYSGIDLHKRTVVISTADEADAEQVELLTDQGSTALQAEDLAVATSAKPGRLTDPDTVRVLRLIGMSDVAIRLVSGTDSAQNHLPNREISPKWCLIAAA